MLAEGRYYDLHPLDMPFSSKCLGFVQRKTPKLPSINEEFFFIDRSKSSMWQRLCLVISRKPIHEQLFNLQPGTTTEWLPPKPGFFKINITGVLGSHRQCSVGICLRDSKGETLLAYCFKGRLARGYSRRATHGANQGARTGKGVWCEKSIGRRLD